MLSMKFWVNGLTLLRLADLYQVLSNFSLKVLCTAVDKNETACELTMRNASRYNLQDRLHVIHGDICTGIVRCLK